MADKSLIEWTDATWNPITGCTLVDEGCRHCYAAHLITSWPAIGNHPSRKGLARKNAAGESKFTGEVRLNAQWMDQPLRWRKPRRIFVCAHGDLFHESVPDAWIDQVFAVMALAPQHTFQVLTKRPDRAREYLTNRYRRSNIADQVRRLGDIEWLDSVMAQWPLPNVWLGTSISDQASADTRVPQLLDCPAAIRFVSAEPLLGPVYLEQWFHDSHCWEIPGTCICSEPRDVCVDWVIVGGESGPHARPMRPEWARSLRDQCKTHGVAFFMKQWGQWLHESSDDHDRWDWEDASARGLLYVWEDGTTSIRLRKGDAGRQLDGRTWDEVPHV